MNCLPEGNIRTRAMADMAFAHGPAGTKMSMVRILWSGSNSASTISLGQRISQSCKYFSILFSDRRDDLEESIADWVLRPCEMIKVSLKPVNFFDRNPSIDVPPST